MLSEISHTKIYQMQDSSSILHLADAFKQIE